MTYILNSIQDLAQLFKQRAEEVRTRMARSEQTNRARSCDIREAITWEAAAGIVEQSLVLDSSGADLDIPACKPTALGVTEWARRLAELGLRVDPESIRVVRLGPDGEKPVTDLERAFVEVQVKRARVMLGRLEVSRIFHEALDPGLGQPPTS